MPDAVLAEMVAGPDGLTRRTAGDAGITCLEVTAGGTPAGLMTIVAAWDGDEDLIAVRAPRGTAVSRSGLTLPQGLAAHYADILDGAVRGVSCVIGNVSDGAWVTGPFTGKPAP